MLRRFLSTSSGLTLQRATAKATRAALGPVKSPERARTLRCCLIGPTNAGKSTLLNALLDDHVSIVSPKIHTTRENTIGFLTDESSATQIEFIDAPGSLGPDVPALHREVWEAVCRVELALIVVDSSDTRSHRQVGRFLKRLGRELDELRRVGVQSPEGPDNAAPRTRGPQTTLILNKVDAVKPKEKLLKVSQSLHRQFAFDWPAAMVSAKTGSGVNDLRGWLLNFARPGEWVAPAGVTHMQPPLVRATEIIREQIFRFFKQELPYMIEQRNLAWTELTRPEGALRIDQQLMLPKGQKSTRKIVEKRLPGLASAARQELRREFGCIVFLQLQVGYYGEFAGEFDVGELAIDDEE